MSETEVTPEPPIYWNGQPWSRESAAAQRQELANNADYVRALLDGDVAKQKEMAALYQIERGVAPTPRASSAEDVEAQMQSRAQAAAEQHGAALRAQADFTDEQIHTIVGQRPILADERQWHINQLNRLKQDKEFVRRYLDGDRDAGLKMRLHTAASVLPIGTLADIERWEAANPLPK